MVGGSGGSLLTLGGSIVTLLGSGSDEISGAADDSVDATTVGGVGGNEHCWKSSHPKINETKPLMCKYPGGRVIIPMGALSQSGLAKAEFIALICKDDEMHKPQLTPPHRSSLYLLLHTHYPFSVVGW